MRSSKYSDGQILIDWYMTQSLCNTWYNSVKNKWKINLQFKVDTGALSNSLPTRPLCIIAQRGLMMKPQTEALKPSFQHMAAPKSCSSSVYRLAYKWIKISSNLRLTRSIMIASVMFSDEKCNNNNTQDGGTQNCISTCTTLRAHIRALNNYSMT